MTETDPTRPYLQQNAELWDRIINMRDRLPKSIATDISVRVKDLTSGQATSEAHPRRIFVPLSAIIDYLRSLVGYGKNPGHEAYLGEKAVVNENLISK